MPSPKLYKKPNQAKSAKNLRKPYETLSEKFNKIIRSKSKWNPPNNKQAKKISQQEVKEPSGISRSDQPFDLTPQSMSNIKKSYDYPFHFRHNKKLDCSIDQTLRNDITNYTSALRISETSLHTKKFPRPVLKNWTYRVLDYSKNSAELESNANVVKNSKIDKNKIQSKIRNSQIKTENYFFVGGSTKKSKNSRKKLLKGYIRKNSKIDSRVYFRSIEHSKFVKIGSNQIIPKTFEQIKESPSKVKVVDINNEIRYEKPKKKTHPKFFTERDYLISQKIKSMGDLGQRLLTRKKTIEKNSFKKNLGKTKEESDIEQNMRSVMRAKNFSQKKDIYYLKKKRLVKSNKSLRVKILRRNGCYKNWSASQLKNSKGCPNFFRETLDQFGTLFEKKKVVF